MLNLLNILNVFFHKVPKKILPSLFSSISSKKSVLFVVDTKELTLIDGSFLSNIDVSFDPQSKKYYKTI